MFGISYPGLSGFQKAGLVIVFVACAALPVFEQVGHAGTVGWIVDAGILLWGWLNTKKSKKQEERQKKAQKDREKKIEKAEKAEAKAIRAASIKASKAALAKAEEVNRKRNSLVEAMIAQTNGIKDGSAIAKFAAASFSDEQVYIMSQEEMLAVAMEMVTAKISAESTAPAATDVVAEPEAPPAIAETVEPSAPQ